MAVVIKGFVKNNLAGRHPVVWNSKLAGSMLELYTTVCWIYVMVTLYCLLKSCQTADDDRVTN